MWKFTCPKYDWFHFLYPTLVIGHDFEWFYNLFHSRSGIHVLLIQSTEKFLPLLVPARRLATTTQLCSSSAKTFGMEPSGRAFDERHEPLGSPIGLIRSCFKSKNGTPRQPSVCAFSRAKLKVSKQVFPNPEHSIQGLAEFSHVWWVSTAFR